MNEQCIQLLPPQRGRTILRRTLGIFCWQKSLQACLMLQAGTSWSPSHPQGGSRYFQLSDLSRHPRERAIRTWPLLLLLPVIAAPGSGRRSRLQDKERAEPIFWSLLGTELLCFYSSCRPYILPGDSRVEHKQTHLFPLPQPLASRLSSFSMLRFSHFWAGASIWPPLEDDGF